MDSSFPDCLIHLIMLQVPKNSVAAKAGLLPTTRGFAGNIVLGDIIVAVDDKPVSCPLLKSYYLSSPCIITFFCSIYKISKLYQMILPWT